MSDKERLEDIKHNHMVSHQGSVKTTSIDLESMEWLIEQAEHKLHNDSIVKAIVGEEILHQEGLLEPEVSRLRNEVNKLREALEFYANVENNNYFADYPSSYLTESEVMKDEGNIARKVLEATK